MLTDAIASEGYKLWRNRTALFWGFLFIPLVAFGANLVTDLWMRPAMLQQMPGMPIPPPDYARLILMNAAQAAGALTILFSFLGAAVIFGGEYRWETWRLMAPRNSRLNHMLGKVAVYKVGALGTILGVTLLGMLAVWIAALINKTGDMAWSGGDAGMYTIVLLSLIGIAWLQLLVSGAMVALAAVVTRSIIGAIMIPMVLSVALAMAQEKIAGPDPMHPEFWRLLLSPGFSAQVLQGHVASKTLMGQQMIEPALAGQALAAILVWIVVLFGAAIILFKRQDLSKE